MKKLLFAVLLLSIVSFSSPVFAQQQINNDGANASDLQQQTGSEDIQQNSNAQQATDVSQNAGAAVLQNAPNQPLDVIGAPANSAVNTAEKDTKWVVLFIILFALLIGPAVVYLREMQVTEEVSKRNADKEKSPKPESSVVAASAEKEDTKKAENKSKPSSKKKTKKGTGSKTKRGKKSKK